MSDAYSLDPAVMGDASQETFSNRPLRSSNEFLRSAADTPYQGRTDELSQGIGPETQQMGMGDEARAAFWAKMQAGVKSGAISQQQFDKIAQQLGYTPQEQQQTAQQVAQAQKGPPPTGVAQPNYSGAGAVGAQLGRDAGTLVGKVGRGVYDKLNAPPQPGQPLDISASGPGGPDRDALPEPSPQWNQ